MRAISGTSGSSGFGSHSSEHMDRRTLEMVSAGDHWDRNMSKQMLPLLFMFGWYMRVVNAILNTKNKKKKTSLFQAVVKTCKLIILYKLLLRINHQMVNFIEFKSHFSELKLWITFKSRNIYLRWFERVVGRKMNCQKENAALVGTVRWSHNGRLPLKHFKITEF